MAVRDTDPVTVTDPDRKVPGTARVPKSPAR